MKNLKPVDLGQKVETRFCAWHRNNKKLFYLDVFFGNYTESTIKVRGYPHSDNSIITLDRNEAFILPYSDNYVVQDGVLYEKSAYEPGTAGYWLDKMDEPERSQALVSMQIPECVVLNLQDEEDSISDAIINAFVWKNTAQGEDYWSKLYDKYCREEYGV